MMHGLRIKRMVEIRSRNLRLPWRTPHLASLWPGAKLSVNAIVQYPIPLV